MARTSYRNFIRLLEQWPVDPTKSGGRDLGEHIRGRVSSGFKHGDASQVDQAECSRLHASLSRLASNVYAKRYPRSLKSSATGLSVEECQQIISTDFLKTLQEEDQSLFSRIFKKK
ncbi:hypothetical protein Pcinc_015167 [Petrolisthes cinctipes]|uniref:Mitochondrial nucleoid factor 1 n=1 Tax=Petrolisthes cinctipes TaxID=88211 RepID=A0AAE1FUZ5_PETCI|nr:hypothetical protein Pcinc_022378 [Petrolisthes cinctipes]KAK3880339.1 hypothetical protein Pcinc_015167 [Petrolisthes cinctipes]